MKLRSLLEYSYILYMLSFLLNYKNEKNSSSDEKF